MSVREIIREVLRTTPIAGDFDKTHAVYANEVVIDKILSLLTSEVEKLKKNRNRGSYKGQIVKYCDFCENSLEVCRCDDVFNIAMDKVIDLLTK